MKHPSVVPEDHIAPSTLRRPTFFILRASSRDKLKHSFETFATTQLALSLLGIGTSLRLLIALTIAFSLLAIPNLSTSPSLPGFHTVHAAAAPNVPWVPAGPAMDTLTHPTFTDETAEFIALQSATPPIDFTDWPIPPELLRTSCVFR